MNTLNKRQEFILKLIKDNKGTQTGEVLSFVNGEFSVDRRTVIRDINILLEKNLISQTGFGRSVSYFISEENSIFDNIDLEKYFSTPYIEREIKENFNFDIFKILEQNIFTKEEDKKLLDLHKKFIHNFSKYTSQTLINKEFERIMIEFSWKSSEIEGNTYSLLSTEALIKENIKEEGKSKEETLMILNHKDAFNEAIQNRQRFLKLNFSDIEYIHKILTKDLGISKNIRDGVIGVTGTKYKPLENSFQLKEVLQEMVSLVNKKKSFFEKTFLSLILTSYIQAFEDGNKRTARMISNAILLANKSTPLSYRIVDVKEYKMASLLFYEINNISYFKKIFIEQFEDAVNNYFN